jgi:hypothetical protein
VLRASAPGYVARAHPVELVPGERPREVSLRDVEIALERGGSVAGRVRTDRGDPATGASVTVAGQTTRADAAGEFHVSGVPPTEHEVRAERAGHRATARASVRADEETWVELELR